MDSRFKKPLTIMLLIISGLSGIMAVYAISIPAEETRTKTTSLYILSGKLQHKALFNNTSIYGEEGSMSHYPESITNKILATYTFASSPKKSGTYEISVDASYYIQDGKNRVVLWNESIYSRKGEFYGEKALNFSIIPSSLNSDLERVRSGTGVSRLQQSITINFFAKTEKKEFLHKISLTRRSGLISFSNPEKEVRESKTSSIVSENRFSGMGVEIARIAYSAISFSALIPAVMMNRGGLLKLRARKLERGAIVVNGEIEGRVVKLDSFEDIRRVHQLSDAPIIKSRDGKLATYTVHFQGIIYEYRAS